ncbi:hypothetical protein [Streptomyces sp. Tu6071]|uniref:hypothetical protein n=1 Tax=Streptomyces sp. Tu6071 TaxID=355249 RepID=UPI0005BAB0B7|nr:hypothetical protein [Streptomyces sp. Tu6071]
MDNSGVERIKQAMTDLCEPLYDCFARAGVAKIHFCPDESERDHVPDFSGRDYRWLRTHYVRAHVHHELSKRNVDPWRLSGNHRRNGELWLTDGELRARVLHGPSGDIPAAGRNLARRAFYRNVPLDPRQMRFGLQEPIFGPMNDRLLILWDLDAANREPTLRVVRPIGPSLYGRSVPVDVDFVLPTTAEELGSMEFFPSDEDINLNIPNEEEGNEFGAGGISR